MVIPAGEWVTGPIHLANNVNLHLKKDALVRFTDNPKDYLPAVMTRGKVWNVITIPHLSMRTTAKMWQLQEKEHLLRKWKHGRNGLSARLLI